MNCPPDIAEILLEIMQTGLLRCRAAGWSNDPRRSAIEADHIHNLPALVQSFSTEGLKYYWEVERPCYMEQVKNGDGPGFHLLWEKLAAIAFQETVLVGEK